MLTGKAMNWPQNRQYEKYRRELKGNPEITDDGEVGELLIDWVLEHIYPDVDVNKITPADAIYLFEQTMDLTNKRTEEEAKN